MLREIARQLRVHEQKLAELGLEIVHAGQGQDSSSLLGGISNATASRSML